MTQPSTSLRGLQEWPKEHMYVKRLQELNRGEIVDYSTFQKGIENIDFEILS